MFSCILALILECHYIQKQDGQCGRLCYLYCAILVNIIHSIMKAMSQFSPMSSDYPGRWRTRILFPVVLRQQMFQRFNNVASTDEKERLLGVTPSLGFDRHPGQALKRTYFSRFSLIMKVKPRCENLFRILEAKPMLFAVYNILPVRL
jgi:hypothetical protein